MKNKNYKLLLIILAVVVGVSTLFVINKNKAPEEDLSMPVKELPLKVESTPLKFNVVKGTDGNILECVYTNDSEEDISSLVLEVKLKDTDEIVKLKYNELVEAGKESDKFTGKGPTSGKVEDVEVLKYKISTRSGTYMEYDVELKQYNWS